MFILVELVSAFVQVLVFIGSWRLSICFMVDLLSLRVSILVAILLVSLFFLAGLLSTSVLLLACIVVELLSLCFR